MNLNSNSEQIVSEIINIYSDISSDSLKKIISSLDIKKYPPNYYFINQGRPEENEYFLFEGIVRSNLFTKKGEDITISFYYEKRVLPPHSSRTLDGISTLNYQSITPVTLGIINASNFRYLMRENPDIYRFASSVMAAE